MQNKLKLDLGIEHLDKEDISGEQSFKPIKLLLDFVIKLNSAFVSAGELSEVLNAVLAGITSGEGLGFNRAFLFLVNKNSGYLEGHCALGPQDESEAALIWTKINEENLTLFDILKGVREQIKDENHPLNCFVRNIRIPLTDLKNSLIVALNTNQALLVTESPRRVGSIESKELCRLFGAGELAIAPLYTHGEKYGVIVADNRFTSTPITQELLYSLHLFAGLASLAVCQSNIFKTLEDKIERLKEVNKAIEDQKHILVETEKYSAIGRMLEGILHEIRNPITSIGGLVKLIEKREDDPKKKVYIDAVVKEVAKIERTLNSLAELHNIGPIEKEVFNFTSLVDMAIALIQTELSEIGIVLHKNYPRAPIYVDGDRQKLQEAILCILKNAIEAMPDGGIMVIALVKKGKDLELRVSDSGLGIARGHFKKVENPFFTTKHSALGLGLSKAKRIFELHKGSLCLTSNRIGGTTCILTLPRIIKTSHNH